ncbi:MAG: glycerate kinase [Clostridiales bacterium]|nr:glycerate kinase [Clostridiales bacterium]
MKKYILVPDSFKGTISSRRVCEIIKEELLAADPTAQVIALPVADGGEGTVEAFLSAMEGAGASAERVECRVQGPFGAPADSFWGLVRPGSSDEQLTAVIEMAACAGLPMARQLGEPNPEKTTTYGVGQLIRQALDQECQKIVVGLGGSATNDGGCGAAAALGARFLDEFENEFVPTGGTLKNIARVDLSGMDPRLQKTEIVAMCDVENPLCGANGAAAVFGPQKGADPEMVRRLDEGLAHLAEVWQKEAAATNLNAAAVQMRPPAKNAAADGNVAAACENAAADLTAMPGSGAAGGMGFGLCAFLGAKLEPGIEVVLDLTGFDRLAKGADWIITGEGSFDHQSLQGKVISGVGKRGRKLRIPLLVVAGRWGRDVTTEDLRRFGIRRVFVTNKRRLPMEKVRLRAEQDLREAVQELIVYIERRERL